MMNQTKSSLPLVSVILPTFNRELLVKDAIASVLNQTYQNLELLVVDDGSTDGTESMISKIQDPRLVYIRQKNSGRSAARNLAISRARGELIAFIDSDDMFYPNKIELQVSHFLKNPECNMIYTSAKCVDQNGKTLKSEFKAKDSGNIYSKISFLKPVTVALPTVMLRKDVFNQIGTFDTKMDRFEDIDLWRRVAKKNSVSGLDICTCDIRTHEGNHLLNQNPEEISRAVDYYTRKVLSEDSDVPAWKLKMGIGRLYYYYGTNIQKVSAWKSTGDQLIQKSYEQSFLFRFAYLGEKIKIFIKSKVQNT